MKLNEEELNVDDEDRLFQLVIDRVYTLKL